MGMRHLNIVNVCMGVRHLHVVNVCMYGYETPACSTHSAFCFVGATNSVLAIHADGINHIIPLPPPLQLWRLPFAQVIFDTDPAALSSKTAEPQQVEEMSQAMIRSVLLAVGSWAIAPGHDQFRVRAIVSYYALFFVCIRSA